MKKRVRIGSGSHHHSHPLGWKMKAGGKSRNSARPKQIAGKNIDPVTGNSLNVLIQGESSAALRAAAKIRRHSSRKNQPCIVINCAAPERSVECALFGSDSLVSRRHISAFRKACRGTMILQEVGQLSERLQIRLQSMLEDMSVRQTGWPEGSDVRVISTSCRQLEARKFRPALYFRLNQAMIQVKGKSKKKA